MPGLRDNGLEFAGWVGNSLSLSQEIMIKGTARPFGKYYMHWDMEGPSSIAATITPYGKGQIAALYLDIANAFLYRSTPVVREFLDALVQELQPGLMTEVSGSHWVDVTLNRIGNSTILNLVNSAGHHDNDKVLVFDEIPVLGPLQIRVRYPSKPKRVMLQPENKPLIYTYEKGVIKCTLPSLEIHEMVVIE